jgi:hypothetical protein
VTADRTYGFSKSDAEALVASIGTTETEIPQVFLGGGGGGNGGGGIRLVIFELTGAWLSGAADADFYEMDNTTLIEASELLDPLGGGEILGIGDVGYAIFQDGNYYFTGTPCPVVDDPPEEEP